MTLYGEKSETTASGSQANPNLVDRSLSWRVANNLLTSFQYAWQGVVYAFRTQRNFRIHAVVGSGVVCLAIALNLPLVELAVIILTSGVVLTLELINTALESVVDLTVQQTYHELAKIAKDCAAGAVMISALIAVAVAACLLLPPLWALLFA
jgi:diacylglycerol kinase (ATP)